MKFEIVRGSSALGNVLRQNGQKFPLSELRNHNFRYFAARSSQEFTNESIAIILNDAPICLAIRTNTEGTLSFFDEPTRVEFSPDFLYRKDAPNLLTHMGEALLATELARNQVILEIPVAGERTNALLETLLPHTLKQSLYVETIADLEHTNRSDQGLRKSHKQSIRKARELLPDPIVHFGELSKEVFEEFRALHLTSAGRQTRSEASWEEQYRAVLEGRALLTTVRLSGALIGGSLCFLTPSVAIYVSGAYDRSLFRTIPISHLTLQTSIDFSRSLGCTKFIVGDSFYIGGDGKQRSIGLFKRGFSRMREHFHVLTMT